MLQWQSSSSTERLRSHVSDMAIVLPGVQSLKTNDPLKGKLSHKHFNQLQEKVGTSPLGNLTANFVSDLDTIIYCW